MIHDAGIATLFLQATESTEEGTYTDTYLKITIDAFELKLPIVATFRGCQLSSLGFKQKAINVDYKVGSGAQSVALPEIVQRPDCGKAIDSLRVQAVESAMPQEQVFTAVALDKQTLRVETEDLAFAGQTVVLIVAAE